LFRPTGGSRNGKIVLIENIDIQDPGFQFMQLKRIQVKN
jgi:hypothetical protein